MIPYFLSALLGYLLGSLNLAWFLSRARGFDIRSHGSNNAGASNAAITMGFKFGTAVALHDVAKACVAGLLAGLLFPSLTAIPAIGAVSAVLGHIFPFYLHFKGGKGFAPFLGLTLALDWRFFLAIIFIAFLITLITDYIVLGTFTTIVSFPVYLFLTGTGLLTITIVCIASLVIFYKHLINLKRLVTGQEIGLRRALRKQDRV